MVKKNNSQNLVDLDQQGLLNSFKNYLRTQKEFKDYDFNGSSMNVLLELLAVNSFKNAFYLNMSFAERWFDSAQLRNSLLSHSKELNYLVRSSRSAKAKITVNFTATGETQPYIIQKGSQFSTLVKSKSLTFTIPETISVSSADTNFTFTTDIFEGIFTKDSYIFQTVNYTQRFRVTNKNVDTRSLTVTVFEDGSEIGDVYKLSGTLLDLKSTSKVFFLQTSETGHYEILFGDNVLGRQPAAGSLIVLDYRLSSGLEGNGAKTFSVDFDPTNANELTATPELEVIEAATNGDDEESNDSIRYYAPRHFQVQERAVINTDYEIILKSQFPEINSIAVFGGEEITPPRFGKVFISVDISDVDGLPDSKKTEYYNFIKERSMFSIDPLFIEPEILYISTNTKVRYNINITSSSLNRIKALVENTILDYNKNVLNDFNVTLRYSVLSSLIDQSDESIISNITGIEAYKIVKPKLGIDQNIIVDFAFPIRNDIPKQTDVYSISDIKAVRSSQFTYKGFAVNIEDDSNGILRIVKAEGNQKLKIIDIGTVDYASGILKVNGLNIEKFENRGIKFYVTPVDLDVSCMRNNIMMIQAEDVLVNVEAFRI